MSNSDDDYTPHFIKIGDTIDTLTEMKKSLANAPHDESRIAQLTSMVQLLSDQVIVQRDLLIEVINDLNLCVRQSTDE